MALLNRLAIVAAGAAVGLSSAAVLAAEPDVVVSTIGAGVNKYGTKNVGTVADPVWLTGYAVTTVSCNIGSYKAVWYDAAGTDPQTGRSHAANEHPVIGTQLYRLHNGRLEMIGMNWLKHGFCAADAPNCLALDPFPGDGNDTYVSHPSCDWLGLFATDTYSASLNGNQSDCGPRSEVNPVTGAFPYPYVRAWNQTGDCVFKRLQVYNSDLSPANYPGARFFCEVHYITTDESSETRRNNASYREMVVGGLSNGLTSGGCTSTNQGHALSFTGSTVPFKAAIEAWKTIDPTVNLSYVDLPNDGRIIVGSKATDLGNGQWQYEYSVYNHNSDRGVGSVSIPKTANPSVTFENIGFKDVPYHSGEPYDGTDWTGAVNASTLSWTVPTPAAPTTPANANAIRWSTAYNFRFTSNQPPTIGAVTLGLFKVGTPGSVDAAGLHIPTMPPAVTCPGDFNQSGGAPTVQDIFDFLEAYFGNLPSADINNSGGVTVQDLFDFLALFFTPCP